MMEFRPQIEVNALQYALDADLLQAIIEKESSGNQYAWNPEPRYRYLWDVRKKEPFRHLTSIEVVSKFPPPDFRSLAGDADQEYWAQQASWGLTQIMGAVARELGFTGPYLTALVDPVLNMNYACQHLVKLQTWARSHYTGLSTKSEPLITMSVLAAWNGGKSGNLPTSVPLRNMSYASSVYDRFQRLKRV